MKEPPDSWKLRLILIWCGLLVVGYGASTYFMADVLSH